VRGIVDPRFPLREEFRDYQLAHRFGWTFQQINEQPAVWLDWMLAIDGVIQEVSNESGSNL
jgi:hypothetical protein